MVIMAICVRNSGRFVLCVQATCSFRTWKDTHVRANPWSNRWCCRPRRAAAIAVWNCCCFLCEFHTFDLRALMVCTQWTNCGQSRHRNLHRCAPPAQDSKVPFPTEVDFTSARNRTCSAAAVDATAASSRPGASSAVPCPQGHLPQFGEVRSRASRCIVCVSMASQRQTL